ncbi:MAG TPA: SufD family Fe-S cluster assembly protein [Acidimicrobiales bacterium]
MALNTFDITTVEQRGGPEWLRILRRDAFERFQARALPTDAEEIWRYSRIADLDLAGYGPVESGQEKGSLPAALVPMLEAIGPRDGLVVSRNGRLVDGAERPAAGVQLTWGGDQAVAIGDIAGEPDALVALNTAFVCGPLAIRVSRGTVLDHPIVVVHWVDEPQGAVFPRTVVTVEENAQARVVEIMASADVACLAVPVTELDVEAAGRLGYLNVQTLGRRAWQIGLQASRVGADADLVSQSIAFGGDYARVRTDSTLVGKGASSRLLAAYFGDHSQMHDFRTVQAHAGPKTTSDLLFKGAVANTSHSVYTGLIRIEKGAVGANAFQTNRNLVLDEGAHADSVPNLEIEESDVRCSHASAVGPIDEEQHFYLESRGVPPEVADRLITLGFLDEVLERTPVPSMLPWLRSTLQAKLDLAELAS